MDRIDAEIRFADAVEKQMRRESYWLPDLVVHRRPGRDLTVPGAGECELGAGETIRLVTRRSRIRRGQGSGAVAVTTVRNTRIPGRCMDREYSDGLKDGNHGWHHRPYSER